MHEGLHSLSGREIEVLRLLLAGHDAKSVARELALSVHTVNDRLRDARRKLGVSSSREAARILAEVEQQTPDFFVAKKLRVPPGFQAVGLAQGGRRDPYFYAAKKMGLAGTGLVADSHQQPIGRRGMGAPAAWLAGGLIAMGIGIAALAPSAFRDSGAGPAPAVSAAVAAQPAIGLMPDLMPIADTNADGKVTAGEYDAFSRQGWGYVSQGKDQVRWAELDEMAQVGIFGIAPRADGVITRQMYIDAIPGRFKMFDQDGDGTLSADEINGRAFQR